MTGRKACVAGALQRKPNDFNAVSGSLECLSGLCKEHSAAAQGALPMSATDLPSAWWSPARHADRKPFLTARGAITRAVRGWFDEKGFAEVETGILQVSPGNETHLHAPRTELTGGDGARATRYLRTSPEFAAKKLLAAGEQRYSSSPACSATASAAICICPNSRCWSGIARMRAYAGVMADTVAVIAQAAQATGIGPFPFRGKTADPFAEPEMLTVAQAFERFAGIDLLATIDGGEGDRRRLRRRHASRVRITDDDTWSDIFSKVLVEHVEPNLGTGAFDRAVRISDAGGGAGADQGGRSARRRTLRGLCLRRRTCQRLRRIDRRGRAAPPFRRRHGREGAALWRAISARRGFSRRGRCRCRRPAASRSVSTGW